MALFFSNISRLERGRYVAKRFAHIYSGNRRQTEEKGVKGYSISIEPTFVLRLIWPSPTPMVPVRESGFRVVTASLLSEAASSILTCSAS